MPQVHKVTSTDFNEGEIVVEEGAPRGHYGFSGDEVELALRGYAPNTQLEKKMIRKVDLSLLPMLWLMCVMAYVDRNNIVSHPLQQQYASTDTNIGEGERKRCWHE